MTIPNIDRGSVVPSAVPTHASVTDPTAAAGAVHGATRSAGGIAGGVDLAVHDPSRNESPDHDAGPRLHSWQRFLDLARCLVGRHADAARPAPSTTAAQRSALLGRLTLDAPRHESPLGPLAFDFSNAELAGADPPVAGISHLRFTGANLKQATLRDISLAWTDFSGAKLDGARLTIAAEMLARVARPSVLAVVLQSIATIDPRHEALRRELMGQVVAALQQAAVLARRDGAMLPSELRTLIAVHPLFAGMPGLDAVTDCCAPIRSEPHPVR